MPFHLPYWTRCHISRASTLVEWILLRMVQSELIFTAPINADWVLTFDGRWWFQNVWPVLLHIVLKLRFIIRTIVDGIFSFDGSCRLRIMFIDLGKKKPSNPSSNQSLRQNSRISVNLSFDIDPKIFLMTKADKSKPIKTTMKPHAVRDTCCCFCQWNSVAISWW